MRVIVAKSSGFCWGVRRAVEMARQLAADHAGMVHTDGPLIHNEEMLARLRHDGIEETDNPAALERGALLIRAHGVPPQRRRALKAMDIEVVDATCPDVARIQGLIRKHARQGYSTLIYGDRGHAEVVGLQGHADGRGHVITTLADIAHLPQLAPVCLVSQSTQLPASYDKIAKAVRARFPHAVVLDTICDATRSRQAGLVDAARDAEVLVVVGGVHSANTLRLLELAQSLRPTRHVQRAEQLKRTDFEGVESVGVAAGASTPDFIITAVTMRLESF